MIRCPIRYWDRPPVQTNRWYEISIGVNGLCQQVMVFPKCMRNCQGADCLTIPCLWYLINLYLPVSFRVPSLALGQWYCPSASEVTLKNISKTDMMSVLLIFVHMYQITSLATLCNRSISIISGIQSMFDRFFFNMQHICTNIMMFMINTTLSPYDSMSNLAISWWIMMQKGIIFNKVISSV